MKTTDEACLGLAELQSKLSAPPTDGIWRHIRTCARYLTAAAVIDSDIIGRLGDKDAGRLAVVEPEVYADRLRLRRGGMYQTWTAVDRRTGRRVVLKERPAAEVPEAERRALLAACLRREAKILAQLQHPSIVTLLEAGKWRDGEAFYAMELVSGETLADAIDRRRGSLEQRLALLPAFAGVVDAVAHAHAKGVIHRDLTPNNIIIGPGVNPMPTIIDWTIARKTVREEGAEWVLDKVELPEVGPTLAAQGTPGYSPREQLTLGCEHDHRVDVFALGATLHFLLTGERPFPGTGPDEILENVHANRRAPLPDCPEELVRIIDKALAPSPAGRYASAVELGAELSRFQVDQYLLKHRYTPLQRIVHSRWFQPLVRAFLVVLLAGAGVFAVTAIQAQRTARAARNDEETRLKQDEAKRAQKEALREEAVRLRAKVKDAEASLAKAQQESLKAGAELAQRSHQFDVKLREAIHQTEVALQALAQANAQRDDALRLALQAEAKEAQPARESSLPRPLEIAYVIADRRSDTTMTRGAAADFDVTATCPRTHPQLLGCEYVASGNTGDRDPFNGTNGDHAAKEQRGNSCICHVHHDAKEVFGLGAGHWGGCWVQARCMN